MKSRIRKIFPAIFGLLMAAMLLTVGGCGNGKRETKRARAKPVSTKREPQKAKPVEADKKSQPARRLEDPEPEPACPT